MVSSDKARQYTRCGIRRFRASRGSLIDFECQDEL
jgi:hypothetical protein